MFILMELGLAIAFGITEYRGEYNKSAIVEWVLALIYIFCESALSEDVFPSPSVDLWLTQLLRCLVLHPGLLACNQGMEPW